MKAIILARVSSREQEEEGHSLAAQVQRLKDYCSRRGLQVIRTVEIVESSTRGKRAEFHELINFAKKQPGTTAVVADAVDRVQRGFKESVMLDELIRAGKIELHFNREGMVIGADAKASDIMRWDFSVMAAKSYVLQLSDNVKRSIEYKLRNGEAVTQSPPGYLNVRNPVTGKATVIIDAERAPLIEEVFRRYATGTSSLPELTDLCNKMGYTTRKGGKPMTRSAVHALIQNPFYYGQMRIKGVLYDHQYPRLISKDLFDACQDVRLGWNKKAFQYRGKESLFRGILQCAVTGHTATMQTKKKRYNYFKVVDPENTARAIWVREDDVIEQVGNILRQFEIPADLMQQIRDWLRTSLDAESAFHKQQVELLAKQLSTVNSKMRRLAELLLDGAYTVSEHQQLRNDLMERRTELEIKLEQHKHGDDGFIATMEIVLDLLDRAHEIFAVSQNAVKRQLVNLVFENLSLRGRTLEYALRSPFIFFSQHAAVVNGDPYPTELELLRNLERIRTTEDLRVIFTMPPVSTLAKEIRQCIRWAA